MTPEKRERAVISEHHQVWPQNETKRCDLKKEGGKSVKKYTDFSKREKPSKETDQLARYVFKEEPGLKKQDFLRG